MIKLPKIQKELKLSHIYWNFAGLALPLVMAAIAVPRLLQLLGPERFGMLALAWGLIGYASVLDLGIGRATTHIVSTLRAGDTEETHQIPTVLFTATQLTLLAGLAGALLLSIAAFTGIGKFLATSQIQKNELLISALLMAVALPMQALSATYRGINEAFLNFRNISLLRVLLGVANFGLPLLISQYSNKIYWLVGGIVLSRTIALYIYRALAKSCIAHLEISTPRFSSDVARNLARFGGWFTVSSVLNPIVAIADRFIIASSISAAATALYVIPYEMVVQSLTVVGAITTVAFPYLSKLRINDPKTAKTIFNRTLLAVTLMMAGVTLLYYFVGGFILKTWLGIEYFEVQSEIVKILSVGLVFYTIGTICISWLHAHGKTNTTAKLNLIEFPINLAIVFFCVKYYGVQGAAVAWVARIFFNALILFYLVKKLNDK